MWSIEKVNKAFVEDDVSHKFEFFEGHNYMDKEVCCYMMSSLSNWDIMWKFLAFINNWVEAMKHLFWGLLLGVFFSVVLVFVGFKEWRVTDKIPQKSVLDSMLFNSQHGFHKEVTDLQIFSLKDRWLAGSVPPAGLLQYMKVNKTNSAISLFQKSIYCKAWGSPSTRKFKWNIQELLIDTILGDSLLGCGLLVCFSIFFCVWRQSGNFRYQ